ncbi:hypothetical protein [Frankia sp. R82]|uniref:hypothetical protein n=1 Tax=Frankia sp. R82 TaxID=2950553 RepID=UPI002042DF43|nr:hypothetical protein [Frankia sp. R82]MCM3884072.1 hypothetical protein [Frankia sp. R82]
MFLLLEADDLRGVGVSVTASQIRLLLLSPPVRVLVILFALVLAVVGTLLIVWLLAVAAPIAVVMVVAVICGISGRFDEDRAAAFLGEVIPVEVGGVAASLLDVPANQDLLAYRRLRACGRTPRVTWPSMAGG